MDTLVTDTLVADPLVADSLADNLIKSIQEQIRRGDLLPGEKLPSHHALAAQYGVGLSTVREAIKALALIGMVDVRPGRGTRVVPDALRMLNNAAAVHASLGQVQLQKVYEARALIETTLTRLAAERATPEDIAEIAAAVQEMRFGLDNDAVYVRADWRFHLAVAQAADNDILAQLYYLAHSLLKMLLKEVVLVPGEKARGLAFQEEMLAAIAAHDPQAAEESACRQMEAFANALRAGTNEDLHLRFRCNLRH